MKLNLLVNPNYEVEWPTNPDFPKEERIILKCKRLSHSKRRHIEDSQIGIDASKLMTSKGKTDMKNLRFNLPQGKIKEEKIMNSVINWSGVQNEDGKDIPFSYDLLNDLLDLNAKLSITEYGSLENVLIEEIDRRNNLGDSEPELGNSETGSTQQ